MDRLRAMELFLSISRTMSFSETARLFGLSATVVSRMISAFEDQLGVKLLMRSTRQVVLTEAGHEYARQVDGILLSLAEAHQGITAIRSAPRGHIRVHARTMFGVGVLPPLIAAFRKQYPEISIELILTERKADLRREQIDIDFRISPPIEAGVKRRMLFHSQRYLVASPDHVAKMPPLDSPADLAHQQALVYAMPGDQPIWRIKRPGTDAVQEVVLKPRHITNNGMVLLEYARIGEGIALLDDYTVAHDIECGRLVRLLPDVVVTNSSFEEGMFAIILDTPMIPTKIRLFLDFVAERVAGKSLRFTAYRPPSAQRAES